MARKKRLDYGAIPHLEIEIYPPRVDRPTDMIKIFENLSKLCNELRDAPQLQHLSVRCLEDDKDTWSLIGMAQESLGLAYKDGGDPDIIYLLYLMGILNNVATATIHLPESLVHDEILQDFAETREEGMMNLFEFDEVGAARVVQLIELEICNRELFCDQ